jgi:hypothetical protein
MTVASSKFTPTLTQADKRLRIAKANKFIRVIAENGRKFLSYNGEAGYLFADVNGHIRYHDPYSKADIYTYSSRHWNGFSCGGTMRRLLICLRQYIQGIHRTGDDLLLSLPLYRNRPTNLLPEHPWAYGEAMDIVITSAHRIFTSSE